MGSRQKEEEDNHTRAKSKTDMGKQETSRAARRGQ